MKMAENNKSFGEFLKALRNENRITLREFCKKASADPANISRIERGAPPPQDQEILKRYAQALDLKENSEEWYTFFDLAALDCGMIPKDIMSDNKVLEMLPVFFRTLREQKPDENEMRSIVEKIKKS